MAGSVDWEGRIGRRLRLRDLHVFFAVVNAGSMAKAARHLRITQPSVSAAIGDLEGALGVQLFDRGPHGVQPTMYGHALVKCGVVVFDELRQGIRNIEFLANPTVGELKVGCPDVIAASIFPPIIERFRRRHPRVVLHTDNLLPPAIRDAGLRERKYDFIIARSPFPIPEDRSGDDIKVEVLFDDSFVIAAGLHTRWARRRKINLAELIDEPWILQAPHTWNYMFLAEAFQVSGVEMPKPSLVTTSEPLRISLLANGPYITVLPISWLRLNAKRYSVKALPIDLPIRSWPICIVTLKGRTLSPVVERFIECAREVAKSMAPSPKPPKT